MNHLGYGRGDPTKPNRKRINGYYLLLWVFISFIVGMIYEKALANDFNIQVFGQPPLAFSHISADTRWSVETIEIVSNSNLTPIQELLEQVRNATEVWEAHVNIDFLTSEVNSGNVTGGGSNPPLWGRVQLEVIDQAEMLEKYGNYIGYAYIWWQSGKIVGAEIK